MKKIKFYLSTIAFILCLTSCWTLPSDEKEAVSLLTNHDLKQFKTINFNDCENLVRECTGVILILSIDELDQLKIAAKQNCDCKKGIESDLVCIKTKGLNSDKFIQGNIKFRQDTVLFQTFANILD